MVEIFCCFNLVKYIYSKKKHKVNKIKTDLVDCFCVNHGYIINFT